MPEEQATPGGRRFYRRIRSNQWQDKAGRIIQDIVFHVRDDTEGLSVFDAAIAAPRAVLQHLLNEWDKIADKSEKDRKWVVKQWEIHGASVEALVNSGWGVAEVPEALFLRCGFRPSAQVDPDGHLVFEGTVADFQEQSLEIIDDPMCRVLSNDECLV